MTKDTIGMRIKNALYAKRMTGFELASKAQISEGGLSQIINGKIKNLKVDTAIRIAAALDMPLLMLIFGKDEDICADSTLYDKDYYKIPRFEVTYNSETHKVKFTEFKYDRITAFHKNYFEKYGILDASLCKSFKVLGDSMEPIIRNGDYVVVDCSHPDHIIDGDIYAFCDQKGLHVKRLIAPLRGGLIIRSDNSSYEDEFLTKEEAKNLYILGHVIDRAGSIVGA